MGVQYRGEPEFVIEGNPWTRRGHEDVLREFRAGGRVVGWG